MGIRSWQRRKWRARARKFLTLHREAYSRAISARRSFENAHHERDVEDRMHWEAQAQGQFRNAELDLLYAERKLRLTPEQTVRFRTIAKVRMERTAKKEKV